MELEVSTWTRRERLERIAEAERDRRAGRAEVALASLGEAIEWPARLVLALAKLADDEGGAARETLEATLDDWAAETGLDPLDPEAMADQATVAEEEAVSAADEVEPELVVDPEDVLEEDLLSPPVAVDAQDDAGPERAIDSLGALEAPIEVDELERAFAEAEAQTEEMHDVNDIAGRVLDAEPFGLAELDGNACEGIGDDLGEIDPDYAAERFAGAASVEPPVIDAAWAAAPIWPESIANDSAAAGVEPVTNSLDETHASGERSSRVLVLNTLERWLENIRAGRAQ